jgi:hypothetical protein
MEDDLKQRRRERYVRLHGGSPKAADFMRQEEARTADLLAIQGILVREGIYDFFKRVGKSVLGSPETAFATFDEDSGDLYLITPSPIHVKINDVLWFGAISDAIDAVEASGGTFEVRDGKYTCVMETQGRDYAEAAQAMIKKWKNSKF